MEIEDEYNLPKDSYLLVHMENSTFKPMISKQK